MPDTSAFLQLTNCPREYGRQRKRALTDDAGALVSYSLMEDGGTSRDGVRQRRSFGPRFVGNL